MNEFNFQSEVRVLGNSNIFPLPVFDLSSSPAVPQNYQQWLSNFICVCLNSLLLSFFCVRRHKFIFSSCGSLMISLLISAINFSYQMYSDLSAFSLFITTMTPSDPNSQSNPICILFEPSINGKTYPEKRWLLGGSNSIDLGLK